MTAPAPEPGDLLVRPVAFSAPPERADRTRAGFRWLTVAIVAALLLALLAGVFTLAARSVLISTLPADAAVTVDARLQVRLGNTRLLLPGVHPLRIEAAGHHTLEVVLTVTTDATQRAEFVLERLPGAVTFESNADGAQVQVGDEDLGPVPLGPVPVAAGRQRIRAQHPLYRPAEVEVEITGMAQAQVVRIDLEPAWEDVTVGSEPAGADVLVDGAVIGTTPMTVRLLEGEREVLLKKPGFRAHTLFITAEAGAARTIDTVRLKRAAGLVLVLSDPPGAGVTIDGKYRGLTPVEVALQPGPHRIELLRSGYAPASRSIDLAAGVEQRVAVTLDARRGTVDLRVDPVDAELVLDGQPAGIAHGVHEWPASTVRLEVRKPGYAPFRTELTPRPGLPQGLKIQLLTVEAARLAAIRPHVDSPAGQRLVLLRPAAFTDGASRREPGRRSNEVLREIDMTRPFYLGTHEVTNAQFRLFRAAHSAGKFDELELDKDDQPAVNITWLDAAQYCNWLSEREGLTRVYRIDGTTVTTDAGADGYRLPTEAEWAWAARAAPGGLLVFPWGSSREPVGRHGNYADLTAAHIVGRIIFGYTDAFAVSAPVGSFAANHHGLFDIGGNVAEWVQDWYAIPDGQPARDPAGPATGEYRVIRGSSWMHGTVTELRLSYRDYGIEGRPDVGFRLARSLPQ